jgi:chitin disaccharide deacetylase
VTALLERLGLPSDARAVVLACDGLGSSNAANLAIFEALRHGSATTAAIQVPSPWARGAAADYHGEDIGVALTLNSEYDTFRWGPITHGSSLLDGDGGFPRTVTDLWDHADLEEARRECRAQLERAVLWGFDVTHLDAHLGAIYGRPEFFDVYLELALEYRLPASLPDPSVDIGFPARELAAEEGILVPDRVVAVPLPGEARGLLTEALKNLDPGVTELHVRPALDTPELRAITPSWPARVGDAHLISHDSGFRAALQRSGARLVSYRDIRHAQRQHQAG